MIQPANSSKNCWFYQFCSVGKQKHIQVFTYQSMKYKRILLKLSGESLMGEKNTA